MKLLIKSLLIVSLVLTAPSVFAMRQHCCTNCIAPIDGTVSCHADCQYPATCRASKTEGYCYLDWAVNTCFNGGYDPCCDPNCCA